MKTVIKITGSGIGSRNKLASVCQTINSLAIKRFDSYEIVFSSKQEAIKALSEAHQYLRSNQDDWHASAGSYTRGSSLSYDAAIAKIIQ